MWARISFILVHAIAACQSANILVMLPLPFYSHTATYTTIFTELARRGHNVTLVSPYPPKELNPNLHLVVVRDMLPDLLDKMKDFDIRKSRNKLAQSFGLFFFGPMAMELGLKDETVQNFIRRSDLTFDLILIETFFVQEPFIALGHKYNAPVVNLNNMDLTATMCQLTGNVMPYSYVPSFKIHSTDQMTFLQRLENTVVNTIELALSNWFYFPMMENYMREYIKYPGSEKLPPLKEMLHNTSLTLVDIHFTLQYPRPYQRNVVEFGGLSVKNVSDLPQDIKNFMDDSKEGVIYFSWGSHFRATNLEPEQLASLLNVFGKLKQRVIMKWENETMLGKPANVYYKAWLPQSSILAHPNCRLFITHGGSHGIMEAMYYGVPIIGTPVFADQPHNIILAETRGFGKYLSVDNLKSEKIIEDTIQEVLNNKKYKKAAEVMSQLVKDRPMTPLENAVYWIEYVIRHKGALHLRPAALDIPWYQYFLLDVLVLIFSSLIVFLWILIIVVKLLVKVCRKTCSAKAKDKHEKKPKDE